MNYCPNCPFKDNGKAVKLNDGSIDVCTSRLSAVESDITDIQKQVDMHNAIMISINLSISKLASSIEYIENRLNELAGYKKKIMFT